jgi:hypothetical protein
MGTDRSDISLLGVNSDRDADTLRNGRDATRPNYRTRPLRGIRDWELRAARTI